MLRHTILFMLLISMASAAWYPAAQNVNTTGDIFAEDGTFSGSISVIGLGTFGGGTVNNGVYDGDLRWAANHSLYSTAGTGGLDFSNETGTWKMPTGQGTIGGATDFNGAITCRNITLDANMSLVLSGAGTISGAATVSATDLALSGDAVVTDDLTVDGLARVDESLTANSLVVNTTADINGDMSTDDITVDANKNVTMSGTGALTTGTGAVGLNGDVTVASAKKLTAGPVINRQLAKTADYVITDTDPDIVVVGAITALAKTNITLPTVADNTGRIVTVIIGGDPGANDVVVLGEGAETINGANTKTNSDQYSYMRLLSTGTVWLNIGSVGTWS